MWLNLKYFILFLEEEAIGVSGEKSWKLQIKTTPPEDKHIELDGLFPLAFTTYWLMHGRDLQGLESCILGCPYSIYGGLHGDAEW